MLVGATMRSRSSIFLENIKSHQGRWVSLGMGGRIVNLILELCAATGVPSEGVSGAPRNPPAGGLQEFLTGFQPESP